MPRAFADRYNVKLVDDIFPQTNIMKDPDGPDSANETFLQKSSSENPDDPATDGRIEKIKSNIHLVVKGAIKLYVDRKNDDNWIRSIELDPSMLNYGAKRHLLAEGYLPLSLTKLKNQVSPLLADPLDAQHIVPGLVQDEQPVAFWSLVDSELLLPDVDIRCLHELSHPNTGPAEGAKKTRIQLGDKEDACVIRFKKEKGDIYGPNGPQTVEGIRVRLILKNPKLTDEFMHFGMIATLHEEDRLVTFTKSIITRVHQEVMARMEGTYLPVPSEWRIVDDGKQMTTAKAMAIASQLTSIPPEEIRAMDEEMRKPSDSTRKRLKKDLVQESGRLTPRPVASLFQSSAYACPTTETFTLPGDIDPMIAEAYGEK